MASIYQNDGDFLQLIKESTNQGKICFKAKIIIYFTEANMVKIL